MNLVHSLPPPDSARPKRKRWKIVAAVGALLLFMGGIAAPFFALAADAWQVAVAFQTGKPPPANHLATGLCVAGATFAAAIVTMYALERSEKTASYEQVQRSVEAGRAYFLYLRPFAIEKRFLLDMPLFSGIPFVWMLPPVRYLFGLEPNLKRSVEEQAGALMLAIGETDRSPGIAKLTPPDEAWQTVFVRFAQNACGVFIIPFRSAGTLWEFDWLVANALDKTVFVLPPVHTDPFLGLLATHGYASQWKALQERYADKVALPDYRPEGLMFSVDEFKTLEGSRWAPDTVCALGVGNLDAAVDHLLIHGRLGRLLIL
jgi:hypothetical protein